MQIIFQIFQFHPLAELDSSWLLVVGKPGLSEAALTASPWPLTRQGPGLQIPQ